MPVTVFSRDTKEEIYALYAYEDWTKTALGCAYSVSPRTIGRVIDEVESYKDNLVDDTVNISISFEENPYNGEFEFDHTEVPEGHEVLFNGEFPDDDEVYVFDEFEYHVVANKNSITINRVNMNDSDDMRTATITNDSPKFSEASDIVWGGKGSQESLEYAFNLIDVKTRLETTYQDEGLTVDTVNFKVTVEQDDGEVVQFDGRLVDRLVSSVREGESITALANFTKKLALNPSYRARTSLYNFIDAIDIEIADDGDLLCFKKIRHDYTDCHTGTINNSPGEVVTMPRNHVNEDADQTCSYGLHVCSASYLSVFGGERTVLTKVNPRDFVAIPKDYNNAKARVCRYEVLREI